MAEGQGLALGAVRDGQHTLRRAHAEQRIMRPDEYSMLWRGPETWVLPTCEELGIGFVCWSRSA